MTETFDVEKFCKKLNKLSTADAIHSFQNQCLVSYTQEAEFIQNCVTSALHDCVVCIHKQKDCQDKFWYKHPTLAALYFLAGMVGFAAMVGFITIIY